MSDMRHHDPAAAPGRPEPQDLDLRDSPGDEPVWTASSLEEVEREERERLRVAAVAARIVDEADSRPGELDLRDSPGDEPVHLVGNADPPAGPAGADAVPAGAVDDVSAPDPLGRDAEAPQQIPARGWLDVAMRVKEEARRDNLSLVAAGIAFYALLSIAPALAAIVSIYGLVSDPADVTGQINDLSSTMPAEARQLLSDQLTAVSSSSGASLTLGVVVGIAVALWGASAAMNQLLVVLTLVNDEEETRGPVKLRATALALTLGAIVFLVAVVGLIAVVPVWLGGSPIGAGAATVVSILRWPLLLVLMLGALSFVYQVGPDRDRPKLRWVTWGAVVATLLWLVASAGFSFYASRFGSYNETYGAMGAVVILMFWLLITALCVLVGAEINAELEHQTTRDSTVGPRQPMGSRGAEVADTVATGDDPS